MFSNYLKDIEGIGIYPIISLLVFFIFFVIMIIWMFRVDKKYLKKMQELPLDSNNNQNNNYSGENNGD